jgi:hypothetical protein
MICSHTLAVSKLLVGYRGALHGIRIELETEAGRPEIGKASSPGTSFGRAFPRMERMSARVGLSEHFPIPVMPPSVSALIGTTGARWVKHSDR